MSAPVVVDWGGEALELRADRSALLRGHRTLLVADVHLGKARAFRQQGVPVPGGTTADTLSRLDGALRASGAEHLVFLGDLLHSRHAQGSAALDEFARWRAAHASLALTLVRGNHDAHAGDPPAELGVAVVDEPFALGGVSLCHHPRPETPSRRAPASAPPAPHAESARPRIAGHVHPCTHLFGRADHLRLPCFHVADDVVVLPAFGAFTGMHAVRPAPGDRLWVVAGDRVVAVPGR